MSVPHQYETYDAPLQGQVATATADPGHSQNSKKTAVPNKRQRKQERKDNKPAEEVNALRAKLAKVERKEGSHNTNKRRKMKPELFGKAENAHPDSWTSAPSPSSAQAFDDVETEEDLQSITDMSTSALADLICRSPTKQDTEKKKLCHCHEQLHVVSSSTAAHSDEGETQTCSSLGNSDTDTV